MKELSLMQLRYNKRHKRRNEIKIIQSFDQHEQIPSRICCLRYYGSLFSRVPGFNYEHIMT
jgi:hypothetical protein